MAITSLDQYLAALTTAGKKHISNYQKSSARTTVAGGYFNLFDLAGATRAGVMAGLTDTVSGGFPNSPSVITATGYLSKAILSCNVQLQMYVHDLVYRAGSYAFNANVTLNTQPSFESRMPNASYIGTELWFEAATAFTGTTVVTVTYTNQDGVTGKSTGAVTIGTAPIAGRLVRMALATGDSGIQKIESVIGSSSIAGTFNILILRKLASVYVPLANLVSVNNLFDTGMTIIMPNTCFYPVVVAASTSSGAIELNLEIVDG
jgi:hypothetical protein